MENREMICIGCPLGCNLNVKIDGEDIIVTGNTCPNGEKYAKEEVTNPKRIVTSTIKVLNNKTSRVSCKTDKAIDKNKIFACMEEIKSASALAPIKIGDILIKNVADSDVNIIATKNID